MKDINPNSTSYAVRSFLTQPNPKKAIVLFHGFPGDKGKKNEDLAKALHKSLNIDTWLIHYRGLGESSGEFSFLQSIQDGKDFYAQVKAQYSNVELFGHSWGGLIAMNLLAETQAPARAVLFSPFSTFPNADDLKKLAKALHGEHPKYLGHFSQEDLLVEIETAARDFNPTKLVDKVDRANVELAIFQASHDDTVPAAATRAFAAKFKRARVRYKELATDHSFIENRELVIQMIVSEFSTAQTPKSM